METQNVCRRPRFGYFTQQLLDLVDSDNQSRIELFENALDPGVRISTRGDDATPDYLLTPVRFGGCLPGLMEDSTSR